ncbi:MAG: TetR/AcrR family transcriptional regulator [Planctomycetes bacterium]|nr:TetR/AcrR family transcriptional regulator [Planctomycetota bacterium]
MDSADTKAKILDSAGILFAANGRDGIGIRGIAEEAGVSVNTVMYHFKNKDNLYCSAIIDRITREIPFGDFFGAASEIESFSPQEAADATASFVHGLFNFFMQPEKRELVDFMVQAIFCRDSSVALALTEAFNIYDVYLADFYKKAGANCSELDVRFLSYTLWPQLMFLVSAREAIIGNMGEDSVTTAFYYEMGKRMTNVFCQTLNLPQHDESIWKIPE